MRVKMLTARSVVIDAINTKNWPAGWEGSVPDTLAAEWLNETPPACAIVAQAQVAPPAGKQFTDEEAMVLRAAAGQIMASTVPSSEPPRMLSDLSDEELRSIAVHAAIDGAEEMSREDLLAQIEQIIDPETGEITAGEPQSNAEVLASMKWAELKELAKQHGVRYTKRPREEIEAELLPKVGG